MMDWSRCSPGLTGFTDGSQEIDPQALSDVCATLRRRRDDAPPSYLSALMEDLLSLEESLPFIIRPDEATEPIRCECCGRTVCAVPERPADAMPPERPWKRGIWEPTAWRRHTLRRCDYARGHPMPSRT